MHFSLKLLLLGIAWIAICLAVIQAEVDWVADMVGIVGWICLSLSALAPFVAQERHRPFWTAYAITVVALLISEQHARVLIAPIIQSFPSVRADMLTFGDGYIDHLEPIDSSPDGRYSSELLWIILPANVFFAAGLLSGFARTLLATARFVVAALAIAGLIVMACLTGPDVFQVRVIFAGWMLLLLTLSWAASASGESKRFWTTYCLATSVLLIPFWTGQASHTRSVLRPFVSSIYSLTGIDPSTIGTVAPMVSCFLIFFVVPSIGLATAWCLERQRSDSAA